MLKVLYPMFHLPVNLTGGSILQDYRTTSIEYLMWSLYSVYRPSLVSIGNKSCLAPVQSQAASSVKISGNSPASVHVLLAINDLTGAQPKMTLTW